MKPHVKKYSTQEIDKSRTKTKPPAKSEVHLPAIQTQTSSSESIIVAPSAPSLEAIPSPTPTILDNLSAVLKYVSGEPESKDIFEQSLYESIELAFLEFTDRDVADESTTSTMLLRLKSIFENFEIEHGKGGFYKGAKFSKHFIILASTLLKHFNKLSQADFLLLIDITIRLTAFRASLTGSTYDGKESIKHLEKVMMSALSSLEETCDLKNLSFMTSCVEKATEDLLTSATTSLRLLFEYYLMPSKMPHCELFEDKHWLAFLVHCIIVRLCVLRESCLRKGAPECSLFADTVERILPQGIFILSRFKFSASLHLDDVEYISKAMLFLREFDARRRRTEVVRCLPVTNFIQLREEIVSKIYFADPRTAIEKLLKAEIQLLGFFKGLVNVEETYVNAVFRLMVKCTYSSTVETICAHLNELVAAIEKSDFRTPTTLSATFLRQYFDYFLSPLKSYPSPIQVSLFANLSRLIPIELKERWLASVFRVLPLHRDTYLYLTNEDVLDLNLHDGAANVEGGIQRCLEFLGSYLEIKSNVIVRKVVTMSYQRLIRENLADISSFAQIVNNLAEYYIHFAVDSHMDKLLGFFTPVLKGIATILVNNNYDFSGIVIAEFLKLILLSDRLHSITDRLPDNEADLGTPFRFKESLFQLRFILRKFASKKEFLDIVAETEKAFSLSNRKIPLLYSVVCNEIALCMSQVALINVTDSKEQVSVTCRFVNEIAMQRSMMSSYFLPTVLTLKIMHNACRSIAVVAESVPYELPPTINTLIAIETNLDPREFQKACGRQTALITLLSGLVELVRAEFFSIQATISTAYSVIEQLFATSRDWADSNFRHNLFDCPAKRSTLKSLSQNLKSAKIVSTDFGIETLKNVGETDISNALKFVDEISHELENWRNVDSWLRAKGFVQSGEAADHGQEADLSIQQIFSKTDSIANRWHLSFDIARILKFFVGQRCNLFDTNFTKYFDLHEARVQVQYLEGAQRNEVISSLTNKAVKALENIIRDEELPLSSLAQGDIRGMMRALKGGRNDSILKELNVVAKYFQSLVEQQQTVQLKGNKGRVAPTPITIDLTERMDRLAAAVELLQLSEVLPSAVEFFQMSNSVLNGRGNPTILRLDQLLNGIRDHDNIKLGQVRELLQTVRAGLFGLELHHLQLIAGLNHGYQLFLFMQSEPDII
eukprot:gene29039-38086_t